MKCTGHKLYVPHVETQTMSRAIDAEKVEHLAVWLMLMLLLLLLFQLLATTREWQIFSRPTFAG